MNKSIPIGSAVRTQAIINRYLGRTKKSLGQNFLVDMDALEGIVEAADINEGDQVVEIGPGIGSLTEQLLNAGAKVLSYEVDRDLPQILRNELPSEKMSQFKLVMKDVLKADFRADFAGFFDSKKAVKVVANLPYYITTPIIFSLAESELNFSSMTLMVQKEVARRMLAVPGTKAYGPLTIGVQTLMRVRLDFDVSRRSFIPRPKVDSSVVTLLPLKNRPVKNIHAFTRIVKMCFAQRRKTLANNLKTLLPDKGQRAELIQLLGVDPMIRPERLTKKQFIVIARFIAGQAE